MLALAVSVLWLGAALGGASWWVVLIASLALAGAAWVGLGALERLGQESIGMRDSLDEIAGMIRPSGHRPPDPDRPWAGLEAEVQEEHTTAAEGIRALRALLDATDESVIACDSESRIVAANRSAMALLAPGSSRPVVGEPLEQLLTDGRAFRSVRSALNGETARTRARLLTVEGPRIVEVAAEPIAGGPFAIEDPPAFVITLRDVTEQAHAMQLKTDFVANASHELRTPLASIRTAAETLLTLGSDSPDMQTRLAEMIAANAERLEELSRDLLDLSRLESPEAECEPARVDFLETTRGLSELFASPCAQRRIELVFEIGEEIGPLWTDEKLVRLVLRNLIDNAIKFAYENTAVRVIASAVDAQPESEPDGPESDRAEQSNERRRTLRLRVIDRGIGIPLPQQQRVFERFFQVDEARTGSPRRRGTGLGLAIVKHALRALDGTIRVESVWQQGTTMTVDLPGCVEPTDRVVHAEQR